MCTLTEPQVLDPPHVSPMLLQSKSSEQPVSQQTVAVPDVEHSPAQPSHVGTMLQVLGVVHVSPW